MVLCLGGRSVGDGRGGVCICLSSVSWPFGVTPRLICPSPNQVLGTVVDTKVENILIVEKKSRASCLAGHGYN